MRRQTDLLRLYTKPAFLWWGCTADLVSALPHRLLLPWLHRASWVITPSLIASIIVSALSYKSCARSLFHSTSILSCYFPYKIRSSCSSLLALRRICQNPVFFCPDILLCNQLCKLLGMCCGSSVKRAPEWRRLLICKLHASCILHGSTPEESCGKLRVVICLRDVILVNHVQGTSSVLLDVLNGILMSLAAQEAEPSWTGEAQSCHKE